MEGQLSTGPTLVHYWFKSYGILLNWWVLPISGASAMEGLRSTGLPCLVYIVPRYHPRALNSVPDLF